MKKIFPILVLIFLSCLTKGQNIKKSDELILRSKEDSMKKHAFEIINASTSAERFYSDSIFTKILVRALKTNNSFYYPFDSLFTISQLYAPDSTFKIFTWQLIVDENKIRQHGAIQMRTTDGSLKLIPLIDQSDNIENIEDTIADNKFWIGAVYYRIIENEYNNVKYYTLIGFDEDNIRCDRKIIEVMHFENNIPIFGNSFSVPNDKLIPKKTARFIMEFQKMAGPKLNYDTSMRMIIKEHLVSESNEPNKKWTLVGDGDYEAFKWTNGKWIYINKIFTAVTPEGEVPSPQPILDDKGNIDETKLKPIEKNGKNP
jgi:hypothetical protein